MVNGFAGLVGLVKQRVDIVEFFEQHGMDVKRSGTRYWALCPFHNEDTPSFSIDLNTGRYYCFGCRETGDVFTYLQKTEGLTFKEALEEECEALHIEYHQDDAEIEAGRKRKIYMEIAAETWRFFREQYDALPEDHIVKAHEIRMKRMISSDAKDNHFLFGWAPASRTALISRLRSKGYEMQDMVDAGVISQSRDHNGGFYCPWSERLMFPICDMMGRPVGFSGRIVHYSEAPDAGKPKRKYVNSRDNEIYHKSDLLFCQSIAKRQASHEHKIWIVEGQFDVIAMQTAGHNNTVASSGTAVSVQQARSLQRMVGDDGKIIFMFDADAAGQKAAIRTFKELGSLQSQAWACVTEGKDPSEMLAEGGVEALNNRLKDTRELWRHVLEALKNQYDLSRPDQSREFISAFNDVWKTINDSIIADSAVRLASLWTGVSVASIKSRLDAGAVKEDQSGDGKIIVPASNLDDGAVTVGERRFKITPAMAINATMLSEPGYRFVLEHLRMDGMDEEFREWLLRESNGGVYPEAPFDLKTGEDYKPKTDRVNVDLFEGEDEQAYIQALYQLSDEMHRYDLASSMTLNVGELVGQQVHTWVRVKVDEEMRSSLATLAGIGASTDEQVLMEYERKVRGYMQRSNDLCYDLETGLHDVFVRLDEMRERQEACDADDREIRVESKVSAALEKTRSAMDLAGAPDSDEMARSVDGSPEDHHDAVLDGGVVKDDSTADHNDMTTVYNDATGDEPAVEHSFNDVSSDDVRIVSKNADDLSKISSVNTGGSHNGSGVAASTGVVTDDSGVDGGLASVESSGHTTMDHGSSGGGSPSGGSSAGSQIDYDPSGYDPYYDDDSYDDDDRVYSNAGAYEAAVRDAPVDDSSGIADD